MRHSRDLIAQSGKTQVQVSVFHLIRPLVRGQEVLSPVSNEAAPCLDGSGPLPRGSSLCVCVCVCACRLARKGNGILNLIAHWHKVSLQAEDQAFLTKPKQHTELFRFIRLLSFANTLIRALQHTRCV